MSSNAAKTKKRLKAIIQDMDKNRRLFTRMPEKDFSRKRKLDFTSVVAAILAMDGGSITSGLLEYFHFSPCTATAAAFVQQRAKLKPDAMEYLFRRFSAGSPCKKTLHGHRLLAIDGSDLQIFADPSDPESYHPGINGRSHYSLLHLNAMYDLENRIYVDALVQKSHNKNEHAALTAMVDRSEISSAILLGDRGFESYNNMAHLQEKGWKFLIRVKDGSHGIASGLDRPETEEYDLSINLSLTRSQTNEARALCSANRNSFRSLPASTRFDFLSASCCKQDPAPFYVLHFRLVRFKISDSSFETVVTNLDPAAFPPSALKALYARRWDIETSFRNLKYTIGITRFHAKKAEFILQEVFARLTMYNFAELITSSVVIRKGKRKHSYMVNFSAAAHVCRNFFLGNVSPPEVEALISRYLSPVRPDRKFPRRLTVRSGFSFPYRLS